MKQELKEIPQKETYLQYTPYKDTTHLKRLGFMIEQVSRHAQQKDKSKLKILDRGCGIGGVTLPLGALGHQVVGVDLDSESISSCNNKNGFHNVTFIAADAETLDLKEKFDVVIVSEVLEHAPHPDLILQTLNRHLIKGGIGLLSSPNGYCLWELVVSRYLQKSKLISRLYKSPRIYNALSGVPTPFYSSNVFCHHVHFFSFSKFKRLLNGCGFEISLVRHSSLGIFPEWTRLEWLKRIECKLADFVPHSLAGGWLFVIKREDSRDIR